MDLHPIQLLYHSKQLDELVDYLKRMNPLRDRHDDEEEKHRKQGQKYTRLTIVFGMLFIVLIGSLKEALVNSFKENQTQTDKLNLQLLERKLFEEQTLTEAERSQFCQLLTKVKGITLDECTSTAIGRYFRSDSAYVYDFRPPNKKRHWGIAVPQNPWNKDKHTKDKNSIADLTVDSSKDTEYINRGLAEELPNRQFKLPNGRIYGAHQKGSDSRRLYPVSGPGIHVLDAWQFWLPGSMNHLHKIGHRQKDSILEVQISRHNISPERVKVAKDLFRKLHPDN